MAVAQAPAPIVWNYAQALCHLLFPIMERQHPETEFGRRPGQCGSSELRALCPSVPMAHNYYLPAADGQLADH